MVTSYSRETIIARLNEYFSAQRFECTEYSDKLGEVRLPLYCVKKHGDKIEEEVVIDVITESTVSEDLYLPTMMVDNAKIKNACSPTFFRFYLPHARVFWAYGYYVSKDDNYEHFKQACTQNGIGLLEVSDAAVVVIENARSLLEGYRAEIEETIREVSNEHEIIAAMDQTIERISEEYIHRLVYYGDSVFRRREIISRGTQDLSLLLLDRLQGISNIQYRDELIQLANGYRKAARDDYQIALDTIKSLWDSRLDTEYPEVQRNFEAVLLLDSEYREHFLHQFQVFLLGALIIDTLHGTSAIQAFEHSNGSTIEDAWLAASTYHDFNYPVEKCEKWMADFFQQNLHIIDNHELFTLKLEKVVVTDEFLSKMHNLCAAIGCTFDDCVLRFILERSAVQRDHAVLGALTFIKKFQNNTKLSTQAVSHAALSILLHDPKNLKCFCGEMSVENAPDWEASFSDKRLLSRLTLDSFPLEFLLAYCDEAQEWGRVGRDYEITKPQLEDIQVDQSEILTHISVEDDTSYNKKRDKIQQLKRYLRDEKFKIKIESRKGGSTEVFRMTGT